MTGVLSPLVIGGDHAGVELKARLRGILEEWGYVVTDVGTHSSTEEVDFPDVAQELCKRVLNTPGSRGIMVCGTGVGAAIACNKIPKIRAAVCHDVYSAHQSVEHDDVNVMCLGAQIIGYELASELVSAFTRAEHSNDEEYRRRVTKLDELDAVRSGG